MPLWACVRGGRVEESVVEVDAGTPGAVTEVVEEVFVGGSVEGSDVGVEDAAGFDDGASLEGGVGVSMTRRAWSVSAADRGRTFELVPSMLGLVSGKRTPRGYENVALGICTRVLAKRG